eukprot:CAMPEP_0176414906 /NCGR_PEP_ID=MMETSP0127-20121128/5517_1 /TAXON_ID=938130 /ORGANISM="Platyophrya macrostoma, Strain WH" /LENGTH=273 /DNA_ID=CAMNT_0017794855 /DNA_START=298 /DNA_END=1119 /DNA_ORIENTATION=+
MSTKRAIYENYKKIFNQFQGPATVSTFQEKGTLTPKEFVEAGDALSQKIPVWQWCAGEGADYLPPDKKYLVLRGAMCFERAPAQDEKADETIDADGWVSTHIDYVPKSKAAAAPQKEINWEDDDEDEDDTAKEDGIQDRRCRLYDVFIVYDQYYQSPRVYLIGYHEDNHTQPLTKEEMMQDVYAANREKTVSVDPHPFLKAACISIHPCRHAETMKRTMDHLKERLEDSQEDLPEAERIHFVFPTYLALFVFLKFISSVVPTIEYDVGIDLDM